MNEELLSALREIADEVRVSRTEPLWSVKEIAGHLGLAISTIEKCVVTRHDFPVAILPTGERVKRYVPDEVKSWAKRQRASLPQPRKVAA